MPVKASLSHAIWMERNPLRQWRKRNGHSMMEIAPLLNVSMLAIQLWENGANRPNSENMAKLKSLVGDPSLPMTWNDWFRSRPKLAQHDAGDDFEDRDELSFDQ